MCRQLDAMMTDWILNVWLSDESNVYLSTRVNRTHCIFGVHGYPSIYRVTAILESDFGKKWVFAGEKNSTPKQKIILSLFFA